MAAPLPPWIVLDPLLDSWLREDIGRGDRATQSLFDADVPRGRAVWIAKAEGVVAGLPVAGRVFQRLGDVRFSPRVAEGAACRAPEAIAEMEGPLDLLLSGERVALNLAMRLSGIATLTRQYVDRLAGLPVQLVDTRKTTPGLRILEKYATAVGGARNHRLGLDDGAMVKDNHIAAAGGIGAAVARVRDRLPYPLTVEVETSNLAQVREAIAAGADIIMLDNMTAAEMGEAVALIRDKAPAIKIEASGNITLANLREVAETGVDYISTSAPITRSTWLDLSMKMQIETS